MFAKVKLITKNLEKVFDFNKLVDDSEVKLEVLYNGEVVSKSMPTGHEIKIIERKYINYVKQSGTYNSYTYEVVGCTNWKAYYEFEHSWGILTVTQNTKNTITITANDQSYTYNANIPNIENRVTISGLALGVTVYSYKCILNGNFINVGTYNNAIIIQDIIFKGEVDGSVYDFGLEELAMNMSISVNYGTLTIEKYRFQVKADDLTQVASSKPLVANNGYTSNVDTSIFDLVVTTSGKAEKPGDGEVPHIVETVLVYTKDGQLCNPDNFDIVKLPGKLVVTKTK